MSQTAQVYVDGFVLRILDSAYLVQVEPANGNTGRYITNTTLPGWVFQSSHAIWLTAEDAPLFERARKGDEIKNQILRKGGQK